MFAKISWRRGLYNDRKKIKGPSPYLTKAHAGKGHHVVVELVETTEVADPALPAISCANLAGTWTL